MSGLRPTHAERGTEMSTLSVSESWTQGMSLTRAERGKFKPKLNASLWNIVLTCIFDLIQLFSLGVWNTYKTLISV